MREGDRVIVLKGKHAGQRGEVKTLSHGGKRVLVQLERSALGPAGPVVLQSGHLAVSKHGFADFRR